MGAQEEIIQLKETATPDKDHNPNQFKSFGKN